MTFQKQFTDNYQIDSEICSTETIFTMSGYRPTKTMIEEFIVAGKKLDAVREQMYEYNEDVDIDTVSPSPTLNKDFDLTDAQSIMQELEDKKNVIHGNYPQSEQASAQESEASEETVDKPVENIDTTSKQ